MASLSCLAEYLLNTTLAWLLLQTIIMLLMMNGTHSFISSRKVMLLKALKSATREGLIG